MNQTITVYQGKRPGGTPPSFLGEDAAKKVRAFHRSLEEYCETPLVSLDSMAKRLGVGGIYVKDESKRFGLNAFKALGASYAVHELLSAQYGQNVENAGGAAGMNAGSAAGNAAFGTALEVDGVRLSNNGSFGELAGIGTRSISVENIESVEVITGVPSAEYGDLNSGMVRISSTLQEVTPDLLLRGLELLYEARDVDRA